MRLQAVFMHWLMTTDETPHTWQLSHLSGTLLCLYKPVLHIHSRENNIGDGRMQPLSWYLDRENSHASVVSDFWPDCFLFNRETIDYITLSKIHDIYFNTWFHRKSISQALFSHYTWFQNQNIIPCPLPSKQGTQTGSFHPYSHSRSYRHSAFRLPRVTVPDTAQGLTLYFWAMSLNPLVGIMRLLQPNP